MKRLISTLCVFALSASILNAIEDPPASVPDSSSSAGMLVLSLLAIAVLRRKFSK